ncbi:patatin-like phospholipase family protein [Halobacteriovorax sp. DA5]|uniref:patatin-like phospholipase family protein n=1 Tax=Halobacteriovorax sp. DA5 TaxID=2067553 RepID=UPI000CD09AF0|nr:patatin-like phospholipase family protein [Halobacteriovorax sp. DA5]POB15031.1 hypothetical protein C0Z22_01245 [Halobacteriovorax sp. DA5]
MKRFILLLSFLFCFQPFAKRVNTALVVSGGVSLGSYEGGFLSYLTEFEKLNYQVQRTPQIYAGASAGSMNALITFLEAGRVHGGEYIVKDSLFWRLWVPLGIDRLADNKQMSMTNFLSKKPIQSMYKDARQIWNEGLRADIDIVFGITLTQKKPEIIEVYKGGRKFPQMLNEAIFRIRGQGEGKPPIIENYPIATNSTRQIYLPFTKNQNDNLTKLLQVIEASGAFPLAFKPVDIEYCKYEDFKSKKKCPLSSITKRTFIDGGMFNNIPLTIVNKVSRHKVAKDNLLLIIDPSDEHLLYETREFQENGKEVAKYVLDIFDSFIGTARSRETIAFYESPSFSNSMSSTVSLPLASSPMYAFFGFFEEDFRRFDFLVGYADSKKFTSDYIAKNHLGRKFKMPKRIQFDQDEACIVEVVERKDFNHICLEGLNKNLKTILKISVAKVIENCEQELELKLCHRTESFKKSRLYENRYGEFRFKEKENITQYTLRKLKDEDFLFNELHKTEKRINRSDAPYLVINKLHTSIESYTDKLNATEKFVAKLGSKAYLDSIYYIPYESYFSIDLGTLAEISYTRAIDDFSRSIKSWRWGVGLMLNSVMDFQESKDDDNVFIPNIGIEKTMLSWSDESLQISLGVRGGYMFSSTDKYGSVECSSFRANFKSCSGVYGQFYPLFTLYEKVRIKPFVHYIHATENKEIGTGLELGLNL